MKTKPIAHFTRNILEDSIFCTYSVSRIMSVVTACASDRISRQVLYSLAADPREDWGQVKSARIPRGPTACFAWLLSCQESTEA